MLLGGCLGAGGPSSEVLRLAGGADDAGPLWHEAGFENPVFYSLPAAAEPPETGFSHQLAPLTYLTPRGSKWLPEEISWFTEGVPAALAHCGIALTKVQIVQADFTQGGRDGKTLREMIGKSPAAAGLTLLFTDEPGRQPMQAAGGADGPPAPMAVIPRQGVPGGQSQPEKMAARSIGHLLGLEQLAAGASASTQGCEACQFTPPQCALMKTHPLVSKRDGKPA
ncbi:MAG: hypothetical protein C0605_12975 [Hyphomicrobiales bacterium]|nr:MAG: hypothetical protein C0605_12975 [Hyphomicrobiales bacterium]